MGSEASNPWEGIHCDSPVDSLKDSPDFFNNIKLHDFPFLKSNDSFVDYLVRCNICKVILLPEATSSHYETRHVSSTGVLDSNLGVLPYEAVSHYNDTIDTLSKSERTGGSKRLKPSIKRSKRSVRAAGHELLQFEAVSETDSLSSLTDETSKKVSNTASEEETDRMREPVLLKLAKTDTNAVQLDGTCLQLPRPVVSSSSTNGERSVWSIVYGTEPGSSESTKNPILKSNAASENTEGDISLRDSNIVYNHSSDSGIGSLSLSTQRPSSYPPTPSISPPLPSPITSNMWNDVVFLGSGQNSHDDAPPRPTSRSSTHSNVGGGPNGLQETNMCADSEFVVQLPVGKQSRFNPSKGSCPDRPVLKTGRRLQRSQSVLVDQCVPSGSSLPSLFADDNDVEVDPYLDYASGKQSDTGYDTSVSAEELRKLKQQDLLNKNGYHAWLSNLRGTQTIPTAVNSAVSQPVIHSQFIRRRSKNMDVLCAYQNPTANCSTWLDPRAELTVNRNMMPMQQGLSGVKCIRASSWRSRLAGIGALNSSIPVIRASGVLPSMGNALDPNAQCTCVEVGELSYRNTVICPIHHTVDEKRQIVRQKDLRTLMREARERVQRARQNLSLQKQSQGSGTFQDFEASKTVIDLTEEASVSSNVPESSIEAADADKLRLRLMTGGQLRPPHRIVYQTPSGETRLNYSVRTGFVDGSSVVAPHAFASRLSRRTPLCDESMTFNQTAPYTGEIPDFAVAGSCPNLTVGSAEQFIAVQRSPHHNEPYFDESGTIVLDDPSVGHPQHRFITLPKRQASSLMDYGTTVNRKQQRRQVIRRAQVAPLQSMQQWSPHMAHSSGEASIIGSSFADPLITPMVEDLIGGPESGSNDFLSTSTQAADSRVTMLPTSLGSQVISGGLDPMLMTSPGSHLSFDNRSFAEGQAHHAMPLVNQPRMANRFNRSIYGGTQVVRETQGRVIVDDMREKSITGRSRKTAKSTYRHTPPVFPPPTYPTVISTRFPHPIAQHQPGPTFVAVNRKPSAISLLSNRSAVVSRPLVGCSTSDLFVNSRTYGSDFESTETIASGRPPFVSHTVLRPTRLSTVRGSPVVAGDAGAFNPPLGTNVVEQPNMDSEFVDLDYCIESSSYMPITTSLSTSSVTSDLSEFNNEHSGSTAFSHQDSRPSTSTNLPLPAVGGQHIANADSAPPIPRNRYFVIRPNSVRHPPGLVLRAKRPESCSLPPSVNKPSDT